jgi:hypothetical protein
VLELTYSFELVILPLLDVLFYMARNDTGDLEVRHWAIFLRSMAQIFNESIYETEIVKLLFCDHALISVLFIHVFHKRIRYKVASSSDSNDFILNLLCTYL